MLGVYLLCVGCVLGILVFNFKTFEVDYTDTVQGKWESIQYFKEKTIHTYDDTDGFSVQVSGEQVFCEFYDGTEAVEGTIVWKNGYSGTIYMEDGFESFVSIDSNSRGDLKINVSRKGTIYLLRQMEEGDG